MALARKCWPVPRRDYVVAPSVVLGQVKVHYVEDLSATHRSAGVRGAGGQLPSSRFPRERAEVTTVPRRHAGTVTYTTVCAGLRELGVKMQPRYLLQMAGRHRGDGGVREVLRLRRHVPVSVGDISTRMAANNA